MDWQPPNTLPEKGENERFAVYMAFDDGTVQLADWLSYTEMGSEYHSNGTYLGEFPQGGDSLYMTECGFDVRKGDDGRWFSEKHHDDGTRTPFYVVGWMEALKPVPQWASVATLETV